MRTEALPLQALNQAIVCAEETTGLIHHSDHMSQYVSVVYNERLAEHGIAASTGTVGDSYDNALAENVNGSYKNELIHTHRWGLTPAASALGEVPQVLFRLMKPVFETTYGASPTPMPRLPQHRLPHQTHDSGIHTLNPHTCNLRTSKIEK